MSHFLDKNNLENVRASTSMSILQMKLIIGAKYLHIDIFHK